MNCIENDGDTTSIENNSSNDVFVIAHASSQIINRSANYSPNSATVDDKQNPKDGLKVESRKGKKKFDRNPCPISERQQLKLLKCHLDSQPDGNLVRGNVNVENNASTVDKSTSPKKSSKLPGKSDSKESSKQSQGDLTSSKPKRGRPKKNQTPVQTADVIESIPLNLSSKSLRKSEVTNRTGGKKVSRRRASKKSLAAKTVENHCSNPETTSAVFDATNGQSKKKLKKSGTERRVLKTSRITKEDVSPTATSTRNSPNDSSSSEANSTILHDKTNSDRVNNIAAPLLSDDLPLEETKNFSIDDQYQKVENEGKNRPASQCEEKSISNLTGEVSHCAGAAPADLAEKSTTHVKELRKFQEEETRVARNETKAEIFAPGIDDKYLHHLNEETRTQNSSVEVSTLQIESTTVSMKSEQLSSELDQRCVAENQIQSSIDDDYAGDQMISSHPVTLFEGTNKSTSTKMEMKQREVDKSNDKKGALCAAPWTVSTEGSIENRVLAAMQKIIESKSQSIPRQKYKQSSQTNELCRESRVLSNSAGFNPHNSISTVVTDPALRADQSSINKEEFVNTAGNNDHIPKSFSEGDTRDPQTVGSMNKSSYLMDSACAPSTAEDSTISFKSDPQLVDQKSTEVTPKSGNNNGVTIPKKTKRIRSVSDDSSMVPLEPSKVELKRLKKERKNIRNTEGMKLEKRPKELPSADVFISKWNRADDVRNERTENDGTRLKPISRHSQSEPNLHLGWSSVQKRGTPALRDGTSHASLDRSFSTPQKSFNDRLYAVTVGQPTSNSRNINKKTPLVKGAAAGSTQTTPAVNYDNWELEFEKKVKSCDTLLRARVARLSQGPPPTTSRIGSNLDIIESCHNPFTPQGTGGRPIPDPMIPMLIEELPADQLDKPLWWWGVRQHDDYR